MRFKGPNVCKSLNKCRQSQSYAMLCLSNPLQCQTQTDQQAVNWVLFRINVHVRMLGDAASARWGKPSHYLDPGLRSGHSENAFHVQPPLLQTGQQL